MSKNKLLLVVPVFMVLLSSCLSVIYNLPDSPVRPPPEPVVHSMLMDIWLIWYM